MKNSETQSEPSYAKEPESVMPSFSTVENYYDQDNKYYKNNLYENSIAQCYICNAEFLLNNIFHRHLKKCCSFTQKMSSITTDVSQNMKIIEFTAIKPIISDGYSFQR